MRRHEVIWYPNGTVWSVLYSGEVGRNLEESMNASEAVETYGQLGARVRLRIPVRKFGG